jgi:hypothetical protein
VADWTVISTTLGASFITGSVGYLSARWHGRVAMEQARMEIAGRTRLTDPHAAAGRGGLVVADENESYQTAATSASANPTLDQDFLEQERLRDPQGFEVEYEARFVGGGRLFLEEADAAAAVVDREELPPEAGPRVGGRPRSVVLV